MSGCGGSTCPSCNLYIISHCVTIKVKRRKKATYEESLFSKSPVNYNVVWGNRFVLRHLSKLVGTVHKASQLSDACQSFKKEM